MKEEQTFISVLLLKMQSVVSLSIKFLKSNHPVTWLSIKLLTELHGHKYQYIKDLNFMFVTQTFSKINF